MCRTLACEHGAHMRKRTCLTHACTSCRANATYRPDFHERRNLASDLPDKVAALDAALRAWHATIPQCAKYQTTPSCEEFSSSVFPGAGPLGPNSRGGDVAQDVATPQDSDPDFWFNSEFKSLEFY